MATIAVDDGRWTVVTSTEAAAVLVASDNV